MTNTTQEELPRLPPIVDAPWIASTVERYAKNYALQCIATLKAENERLLAEVEQIGLERLHPAQAELMIQEYKDKAEAMAGLLERAARRLRNDVRPSDPSLYDFADEIDAALAAWKGKQ
jgi:hypothetical protein